VKKNEFVVARARACRRLTPPASGGTVSSSAKGCRCAHRIRRAARRMKTFGSVATRISRCNVGEKSERRRLALGPETNAMSEGR